MIFRTRTSEVSLGLSGFMDASGPLWDYQKPDRLDIRTDGSTYGSAIAEDGSHYEVVPALVAWVGHSPGVSFRIFRPEISLQQSPDGAEGPLRLSLSDASIYEPGPARPKKLDEIVERIVIDWGDGDAEEVVEPDEAGHFPSTVDHDFESIASLAVTLTAEFKHMDDVAATTQPVFRYTRTGPEAPTPDPEPPVATFNLTLSVEPNVSYPEDPDLRAVRIHLTDATLSGAAHVNYSFTDDDHTNAMTGYMGLSIDENGDLENDPFYFGPGGVATVTVTVDGASKTETIEYSA